MGKGLSSGRAAAIMGISRQAFHTGYIQKGLIEPIFIGEGNEYYFAKGDVTRLAKWRQRRIEKKEKRKAEG